MTLQELKEKLCAIAHKLEEPMLEARVLLSFLGFSPVSQITEKNSQVDEEIEKKAISLMEKRASGCPMAYITGEKEFWGLTFRVTPSVLIPRPDTETLVEKAITLYRENNFKGKILDLCTGSGAVGTAIAHTLKRDVCISDLSTEALSIAKENYSRTIGREADAREGDLFSPWKGEHFSVIATNPPYLTSLWCDEVSEDVKKEPMMALLGFGDDGLDIIRRIITESVNYLEKGGYLLIESDYRQCADISSLLASMGYMDVNILKDLSGKDRVTYGRYDG